MKKILYVTLALILFSCGTKKHSKCDAYGNKSGYYESKNIEKDEIG
jgi:hypothetical protein